jgi:hypothetical protein
MTQVTGRDSHIILQALAYAIETIARLPPEFQELSNMQDMAAILKWGAGSNAEWYRQNARDHIIGQHSHLK